MATGNGKIANLPREIREQLNWRINDDVPGIDLVAWLNSKPEVQAVMKEHYEGRPISEQNLSEWRKYGYQKWLSLHIVLDEAHAISEDADQIAATGVNCENLLLALTASYGAMIQNWNVMPAEQLIYKMGIFKNLTNAVLTLRRAELQATRLQFERERLELLREKQRSKSASSSSSRPATRSENGGAAECVSNDRSEHRNSADRSVPASPVESRSQQECESSNNQPSHAMTSSQSPAFGEPSIQPARRDTQVAPPPSASSTEQLPAESAPANPPSASTVPASRDPRSRYSLL